METFIVRVRPFVSRADRVLRGVVEIVGSQRSDTFRNQAQLLSLLKNRLAEADEQSPERSGAPPSATSENEH